MRAPESQKWENIDATPADFKLYGGVYMLDVVATFGGGSVTLTRLAADNSTYLTAMTAITAAGMSGATPLPPGQYRLTIATATAVYASLVRIPGE